MIFEMTSCGLLEVQQSGDLVGMLGGPEQRRWCTHVESGQCERPSCPKAELCDEGAELLGERSGVVASRARRLIGVTVSAHVRDEHRAPCVGQLGRDAPPRVTCAEESMLEEHRWALWVAADPVVEPDTSHLRRIARKTVYRCNGHRLTSVTFI